jgi:hypothetical protein
VPDRLDGEFVPLPGSSEGSGAGRYVLGGKVHLVGGGVLAGAGDEPSVAVAGSGATAAPAAQDGQLGTIDEPGSRCLRRCLNVAAHLESDRRHRHRR